MIVELSLTDDLIIHMKSKLVVHAKSGTGITADSTSIFVVFEVVSHLNLQIDVYKVCVFFLIQKIHWSFSSAYDRII